MIRIENLRFQYPRSDFELSIDRLHVADGAKVAIVGPSGSGKTTLLNLIAGIGIPQTGTISVADQTVSSMSDAQRRDFRIRNIGMVFQQFELVDYLRGLDNVLLPYSINRSLNLTPDRRARAVELATAMGLDAKIKRWPHQLSQGEQQRVAICRALIAEPQLVLADEPTGNLDPANKTKILNLLFAQCDQTNQTLVVVTHDMAILDGFDEIIDFERFRKPSASGPSANEVIA